MKLGKELATNVLALRFLASVVVLVAALSPTQSAHAGTCDYVNLTEQGRQFQNIPTYDQGGGQICYAYTAAQLVEGERVAQGHPFSAADAISPMSLALNHALLKGQRNLQQGGITCHAITSAKQQSVCPASKSFKNLDEVERLLAEFDNCRTKKSTTDCANITNRIGRVTAAKVLAQDNPLIYAKAVEDTTCSVRDKVQVSLPECVMFNEETYSAAFYREKADFALNSPKPKPIEFGYSSYLFSYSGYPAKKYVINRKPENDDFMFSIRYKPHASMILGRRQKGASCQYLVRNSQGKSFCPSGLVKNNGWECDAKSEGVWVNARELFDATFEISYFK